MTYEGHCHCERVRFTLQGAPLAVLCCHCTICQQSTGAPFAYVGMWRPEQTEITAGGPLASRQTSGHLTRHRCPDCGAAIFNAVRTARMNTDNFMIPLVQNRADGLKPSHHIYYADRSMDVNGDLPTFDGFKWL
jgi:hypothetical protein